MANTLKVLRVQIEGVTASFRYPHFLVGRQPTYAMPPPSTILGMIGGAIGAYPTRQDYQFAYTFKCERNRVDDLETIWSIEANTSTRGLSKDYNINAVSNVLPREWLIHPKMTLYISGDNLDVLELAFKAPCYAPVLGRSQDLVTYTRVEQVELTQAISGRLHEGLYPMVLREDIPYGASVMMPKFIDPDNRWDVNWEWYVTLDYPLKLSEDMVTKHAVTFWNDTNFHDRILVFQPFI